MWTRRLSRAAVLALGVLAVAAAGPAHGQGPSLRVLPPPGQYATTQRFDLVLLVETGGRGVVGGTATLDGVDVTGPLLACARVGATASGAFTVRCPGISAAALGPGIHVLRVVVNLSDGTAVEGGALWEVLTTGGP